jgi:hypothetical protein
MLGQGCDRNQGNSERGTGGKKTQDRNAPPNDLNAAVKCIDYQLIKEMQMVNGGMVNAFNMGVVLKLIRKQQ